MAKKRLLTKRTTKMIIINFLKTIFYYASFLIFMILFTIFNGIIWLVTLPFDKFRRVTHKLNSSVGYMLMMLNPFWRVKIFGRDKVKKGEAYLITPNHQSLTDIAILAAMGIDLKWVAKKELTYIPFLGWVMAMAKDVLLDRKDPKSQFKMMRSCENFLKNDISIAIFPEGTRSKNGELGRFRDGAALLARKTGKKIIPVCMIGNDRSMPEKGFIWTKRVNMEIHFLDPIDPADYEKTKELSNAVKESIQNKLNESIK